MKKEQLVRHEFEPVYDKNSEILILGSFPSVKSREQEEVILKQLEEKEPLPDKKADQMAWVRAANQHRAIAEEIILKELIYV